ncbi:MAG: right-handed parallel beta-helix repeat-containing protein [Planctomycetota bacterium]
MSCYDSFVEIIDSILWGNTAVFGPQIGIGDPLESDNPISTVMLTYSDVQGGEDDVFVGDDWGPWLLIPSDTNIDEDPQFAAVSATDPLKNYYLSQSAAGQQEENDSPCVDAGSTTAAAVGLDTETTRTDHVADSNEVDMGYHYDASVPVAEYVLTTRVYVSPADLPAHGILEVTTEPNNIEGPPPTYENYSLTTYRFTQGTVVDLLATPKPLSASDPNSNYRVRRWTGTDSSQNNPYYYGNKNSITMTASNTVLVEFEYALPKRLYVPDSYVTIEDALTASRHGDTIILSSRPGQPYLISNPQGINFGFNDDGSPKQIHLRSTDPNESAIVKGTIIDVGGSRYLSKRAFLFNNGATPETIIEGITIRNAFTAVVGPSNSVFTGYWPWPFVNPPDPLPPFRAMSGADATGPSYGGAILCDNNSSPTIRKCRFEACTVSGGIGGDGANGLWPADMDTENDYDSQSGGHAGNGSGNGYGGAIAIRNGSGPQISDCEFIGNRATGGWGGIPGNAGNAYNAGRFGWGGNAGNATGDGRGGAIYVAAGCDPMISHCTFDSNYARPGYISPGGSESPNGGPYPEPWDADPWAEDGARGGSSGTLTDNGTTAGGAIYCEQGAVIELEGCSFVNSEVYDVDGLINGAEYALPDFTSGNLYSKISTRGGAIYCAPNVTLSIYPLRDDTNPNLVISEPNFINNIGGAIYCSTGVNLNVEMANFVNNKSYFDPLQTYIQFSTFDDPSDAPAVSRQNAAGAITIEVNPVNVEVDASRFLGNESHIGGGALYVEGDVSVSDSIFNGNLSLMNGGAFYSYYDTNDPLTQHLIQLEFDNCEFSGNESKGLGGAGYLKTGILDIKNSFFLQNTAYSGGGLYAAVTDFDMTGTLAYGNKATGRIEGTHRSIVDEGLGGGFMVFDSEVDIDGSRILNNHAQGVNSSGGGLCIAGGQTFKPVRVGNTLIAGNIADNSGAGLSCLSNIEANLSSCTFADNDSKSNLGGAIFVDHTSAVDMSYSIVSGNIGYGIYENQTGGSTNSGGQSDADYTLFYNNTIREFDSETGDPKLEEDGDEILNPADMFDAETNRPYTGESQLELTPNPGYTNVLVANPAFVTGFLDDYYLTQTGPAVDPFDDPFLYPDYPTAEEEGLNTLTTDPSNNTDQGRLDLGYHYEIPSEDDKYVLDAQVEDGHGTVSLSPDLALYYRGSIVNLTANVDNEYFMTGWSGGTVNDNSREAENVVLITRDKTIEVLVRLRKTWTMGASADFDTLGDALDAVDEGDIILVVPGQYTSASQFPSNLTMTMLNGKNVTISGTNPDDMTIVRSTVFRDINFLFSNLNANTVIEGITLEQSRMRLQDASPILRNCAFVNCNFLHGDPFHVDPPPGTDGYTPTQLLGGALTLISSSPQVIGCVFENNSVTGGNGENGFAGDEEHGNGGDGGWPGAAYGGAVYCGLSSKPDFIGCTFTGNQAVGGNGGDGADFVIIEDIPQDGGRGGGWEYENAGELYLQSIGWDGWTYNAYGNKYGTSNSFYSDYYGEYDIEEWRRWFNWSESITSWDDFFLNPPTDPYDQMLDAWRHSGFGGAVFCELDSSATFIDCTFENNQSYGGLTGMGGTQYLDDPPWPDRELNMPTAGGAVFAAFDSDLEFTNCVFRNNAADTGTVTLPHTYQTSFGGAVAYEFGCEVTFIGGGLYGFESKIEVVDCNIFDNEAYLGAGAFFDDQEVTMTETKVYSNLAEAPDTVEVPGENPEDPPVEVPFPVDVMGDGAGVYAHVLDLEIRDCQFYENTAEIAGGGLLLSGTVADWADIFNCLFVHNTAGRDGAGASVNWSSRVNFGNCTFADNTALGVFSEVGTGELVQDSPGLGGGLYCSYDSICEVIDSIFWNNLADYGDSIYLGAGSQYEPRPSELTILHSDVENYPSTEAIFVEDDCPDPDDCPELIEIEPIINDDPVFVTHPDAAIDDVAQRYYLDQDTSPCVGDVTGYGSDLASTLGLSSYVTSIDKDRDQGVVDLGYHYRVFIKDICSPVDLVLTGTIDLQDWAAFAIEWLTEDGCDNDNNWCSGRDFNYDGSVDVNDIERFVNCWLTSDADPPEPNPAAWEIQPTDVIGTFDRIQMRAVAHHDDWWPDENIEYYFDCVDPFDGPDRDWATGRDYTASNLAPGSYSFLVKARDGVQGDGSWNETNTSVLVTVTPGENTDVPQALWDQLPTQPTTSQSVTMSAESYSSFGNPPLGSGYVIKYEFAELSGNAGGNSRAYSTSRTFTDSGLQAAQTYSYQVRMGLFYDDVLIQEKEGEWSDVGGVTINEVDETPPVPNPAQHASGSPFEIYVASELLYYHVVTAFPATDNSGVEYKFVCGVSSYSSGNDDDPDADEIDQIDPGYKGSGPDNGWRNATNTAGLFYPNGAPQVPQQYWARRGAAGQDDEWVIIVRDLSPNQNTTVQSEARTIFTPAP